MGKKGSWFSTIKRVFVHESKDKPSSYGSDKRSSKEKKASKGILHHGEAKSFLPRFKEPSSIEKILGEADQLLVRPPPASSAETRVPPASLWRPASPTTAPYGATSPNAASQRVSSTRFTSLRTTLPPALTPEANQSRWEVRYVQRPEMSMRNQHRSATMIQSTFRGYLARRNFRALRGLVRLQGVVRSTNAKRQTMNAMKQMQLLVRIQTQIQSRRVQMLENQAIQHQAYRNNKELESNNLSKWSLNQLHEAGDSDDWDDSVLTKEEIEGRLRKKVEAVMKRERAMAYAYSHRSWKAQSSHGAPDIRSNGLPWWWNWLERQLPPPPTTAMTKDVIVTPPRPVSEHRTRPRARSKRGNFTTESHEIVTPLSTRSTNPTKVKPYFPAPTKTLPPATYDHFPLRGENDDGFSVPNYMTPTASAKAKARASSNPKERVLETPANESKRRFSFSLTSNMIGSFKWNRGSAEDGGAATQKAPDKHTSSHFRGDLSVDSTVSMPAAVGRRPFNRFV
ncbi:protein IQ-DOMAIN 14-like [Salvia miltiorrhiza]|uniref:protein IQ-DOMAIN 14-like n=1 Tax=Salvia miltiorrhiza TaxID=226208 RepID=UPI0025AD756B|nr:protein IQ-DOMAIN 14-like [Salvia miltiorrhiza]XP_057781364.1 protein IQ-DOMAIN 14-like [Salvia miltiorrhiza]